MNKLLLTTIIRYIIGYQVWKYHIIKMNLTKLKSFIYIYFKDEEFFLMIFFFGLFIFVFKFGFVLVEAKHIYRIKVLIRYRSAIPIEYVYGGLK